MDASHRSRPRSELVAWVSLAITVVLAAAKIVVWAATSSLAVLSQALDSVLDVLVLGLLIVGIRIANKPADESHHYGHAKAENLVAYTQVLILGAVVLGIVLEAARRLGGDPTQVDTPWYALALFGGSAVIDLFRARWLAVTGKRERSDALMAGALNVASDVVTAVIALISLLLVRSGSNNADSYGALVVAVLVTWAAIRLGKRSLDVLMDRAPGVTVEQIEAAATRASGVNETRRVRVRGTDKQLFADVTVAAGRTSSLERAHDIAESVESEIHKIAPGADVVVHVEPVSETGGLVERVQAAASRTEGVREVHNVSVHAFDEGGRSKLHVTLHAKTQPGTTLQHAHDLSDRIEAAVESELGTDARVDTHIEPLEPTTPGTDVTGQRSDVVDEVRRLAVVEPDVLDCHEVIVTSVAGELSVVAHVRGRADLALDKIHAASQRIEKAIHGTMPEVGAVLIHFEPR